MKQNEFGAFILSETKNGERIVSCGGRISTRQGTAVEIYKKSIDKTKNLNLISKVISSGHTTILEHHYFNIAFNNVSVFVEQFLIEFRLASFTIKSGRYVNFSKSGFNLSDEFSDEQKTVLSRHYRDMLRTYDELVQKGVPIEDARFVLPNACCTKIVCTFNARSLDNFFAHRCCNRAQWEIQSVAEQMLKLCLEVAPNLFKRCGPPCLNGACPEGKMTCGKQKEVRERYGKG